MKTLVRGTILIFIAIFGLSCFIPVSCTPDPIVTSLPYNFQSGLINVIQISINPATPFKIYVEEEYPVLTHNYTVGNDGWLVMTSNVLNGTRPIILVNEESTFLTKNPFFTSQVFKGDHFELILFPPEHLNSSFTVGVTAEGIPDYDELQIYDVYTWDDLIGEIIFTETPRHEINTTIFWTPDVLVENSTILFSVPSSDYEYDKIHWTLTGENLALEETSTHFKSPQLRSGDYTISVFIEDSFGYNKSESQTFTIQQDENSILLDPALTNIQIIDIEHPTQVDLNSIQDITVSINYSVPISRDIRISLIEVNTGNRLTHYLDNVNGNGVNNYTLSLSTNDSTLRVEAVTEFLHENEWVDAGEPHSFELTIRDIPSDKSIPGFSVFPILLGLFAVILIRKYWN